MSTPTPGPWAFTKSIDSDGDVCFDISQETGAEYTTHLSDVAYCRLFKTYVSEHGEIQEKNARLIAAAPELLNALQWFIENYDTNIGQPGNEFWEEGLNLGISAIAKATGAAV